MGHLFKEQGDVSVTLEELVSAHSGRVRAQGCWSEGLPEIDKLEVSRPRKWY